MERESEKDSNPRSGFRGKDESLFNFEGVKTFKRSGGVAQLGEHLLCKQGVIGSIPFISTKGPDDNRTGYGLIAQLVRAHA